MIDWNIQARAHTCQACHRHFADKETFHTLLYDQKQGYERLDVCEDCWKTQISQGGAERKGFISHWTGVYSPPPAAPPEPIGKETAESLLRKLVEQNDPTHLGARFILAVMLERKRLLKVKAQIKDEAGRTFIYEHGKSGDLFNIRDPDLQLDQLESVQRDVAHLLEHGLAPTAASTPAPSAETAPETQAATPPATPVEGAEGSNDAGNPPERNDSAETASP